MERNETNDPLMKDLKSDCENGRKENNNNNEEADKTKEEKQKESNNSRLLYSMDSIPPLSISILYGIQQVLTMLSGPVTAAFIIRRVMCSSGDQEFLSQLISTNLFMSGLCTILQVLFGVRLPIIQGSSFTYFSVLVSMMTTSQWQCPKFVDAPANGSSVWIHVEGSNETILVNYQDLWKPRMLEASGCLIVAATVQILLGTFGLIGLMMRFIGPITIATTVTLIGLSICDSVVATAKYQWGIALSVIEPERGSVISCKLNTFLIRYVIAVTALTFVSRTAAIIIIVLSFLRNVSVPVPSYSRTKGCHTKSYLLFRLFPQTIAVAFGWTLCAILTVTNVFPNDPKEPSYYARTDRNLAWISQSSWFFIPYPGMWGWPTFSFGTFSGMLAAVISSTIESVGDYYATARAAEVPAPPKHAMNRGIAMEGFGSIFCGFFGAGHATTSYSGVIGFITLTGMASRRTWVFAGIFLMSAGMFGKLSAVLSTIPEPVIGGLMSIGISMVIGVGVSTLHFVDLGSGRNLLIIGMSLLLGTSIPSWVQENREMISTGSPTIDQIIFIILNTSMLVGGVMAFIMDNILPGTKEERGITSFNQQLESNSSETSDSISCSSNEKQSSESGTSYDKLYDFPFDKCCSGKVKSNSILTYIPILPCYIDRKCGCTKSRCCTKRARSQDDVDESEMSKV